MRRGREHQHRELGWAAWHIALLGRADKIAAKGFPALEKLIGRERRSQRNGPMSPDEIMRAVAGAAPLAREPADRKA